MSKVWRHADGREFPATYHYAQDMPDYHSAQVGEFTVSQTLMQILGYTLVEREDPKEEKMEPKTISLGEAMERLRDGLPVECKSGRSGVWEPMRKRGVNAQFRQGDTWRGFPNILAAGWSFRIPVEDPPKAKVYRGVVNTEQKPHSDFNYVRVPSEWKSGTDVVVTEVSE